MANVLQDGLARQLARLEEQTAAGDALGGWKVGLTSGRARDAMGAGFRPFGYLLRSRMFSSPANVPLAGTPGVALENELCFTIGQDLQGNPDRRSVIDAVAGVSPAFEIAEQRLGRGAEPADMLADNLSQWGTVVGEPRVLDWSDFDFRSLTVTLCRDGRTVERVAAAGHIDDHFDSIGALVRMLNGFGLALHPGQRIITGSYTRQPADGAGHWTGDFGPDIGSVELTLS